MAMCPGGAQVFMRLGRRIPKAAECEDRCECIQRTFEFVDDFCSFPGPVTTAFPPVVLISGNGNWIFLGSPAPAATVIPIVSTTGWWTLFADPGESANIQTGFCFGPPPGVGEELFIKFLVAGNETPLTNGTFFADLFIPVPGPLGFLLSPPTFTTWQIELPDGSLADSTVTPSSDCRDPDELIMRISSGSISYFINGSKVAGPGGITRFPLGPLAFAVAPIRLNVTGGSTRSAYDVDLVCATMPRFCRRQLSGPVPG